MDAEPQTRKDAAGAALLARRGITDVRQLKGFARVMYENLTERELAEMAETFAEELPGAKG